ncbi:MAG: class I SAM-dependent methyltransferase [Lachnospiraceae bacterium]|nr:class I SAM-dependent methyltransferase [Lachnospiraceae bacterium]
MSEFWKKMEKDKIPSSLDFDDSVLHLLLDGSRILDLGCGNGGLCKDLAEKGFDTYGIDCSVEAINNAKENDKKTQYLASDASELSFQNDFFDFVIIKAVFTVIPDSDTRNKIMNEVYRVTKKGGLVYIADFAQTWWNSIYYQRYKDNFPITGEYGVFRVFNKQGKIEYIAKHFSPKEIVDLYSRVDILTLGFDTTKVQTRSGNIVDGYKILLQKNI